MHLRLLSLLLVWAFLWSSCRFLSEKEQHEQTASAFVQLLLARDYETAMLLLDETLVAEYPQTDTLEILLSEMAGALDAKLGGPLQASRTAFWEKRKVYRTDLQGNRESFSIANCVLEMESADSLAYAAFSFSEDGRILKVRLQRASAAKPGPLQLVPYFLLLALGLSLTLWVAYTVYRVVRSELRRKWLWSAVVVVGNVTSVGYGVLEGWFFKADLSVYLLPMGFTFGSYLGWKAWVAFPLGTLAAWSKLWHRRRRLRRAAPERPQDQ